MRQLELWMVVRYFTDVCWEIYRPSNTVSGTRPQNNIRAKRIQMKQNWPWVDSYRRWIMGILVYFYSWLKLSTICLCKKEFSFILIILAAPSPCGTAARPALDLRKPSLCWSVCIFSEKYNFSIEILIASKSLWLSLGFLLYFPSRQSLRHWFQLGGVFTQHCLQDAGCPGGHCSSLLVSEPSVWA